jgi:glutaredoxin 3
MPDVVVYTSDHCSFCDRAKSLLAARDVPFEEVRLEESDHEGRVALAERTGQTTLPQIFIGGTPVGGFHDLHALDRAGTLARMLSRE